MAHGPPASCIWSGAAPLSPGVKGLSPPRGPSGHCLPRAGAVEGPRGGEAAPELLGF